MSARLRLALFAVGLLAVFGAAAAVGASVPEVHEDLAEPAHGAGHGGNEADEGDEHGEAPTRRAGTAAGSVRIDVEQPVLAATPVSVRFRIFDGDAAVAEPDPDRIGVRAHAFLVARDLGGFFHVHPTVGDDGVWTADVGALRPGAWRLLVDVVVDGVVATPAAELFVPGAFTPEPVPAPAEVAMADDVQAALTHDEDGLTYRLMRGGAPLDDTAALAAGAHLVLVRVSDGSLVAVEPGEAGASGAVAFAARFPSPGQYRAFLEFQVDGRRTVAAHTVEVTE